jgi:hypothetical protein
VTRAPWDYLFESFNSDNFPDIFHPTWIASAILLVSLLILYYVRTRALHRHPPYLEMWEWLLWSGLITFGMLLVEAVFVFSFFIVLTTMFIGLGTLVWIRFIRFPPFLAAYDIRLAKQRYISRQKYADPEATIKKKGTGGRRQRQRRRR